MKVKHYLTLLLLLLGTAAWGYTKTEGFEHATTSTNYKETRTITEQSSDCEIGWEIYYGAATTTDAISGNNSVQLRYYSDGKQGNIHTTTAIEGLTNVSFKAKVSNINLKINIAYSEDGSNWEYLVVAKTMTTTATEYSYDIPSGGKYFKAAISSQSTTPSSGNNYKFTIDDIVFTYTPSSPPPSYSFTSASNNPSYGTVSTEGNVITATPEPGYQVNTTNPFTVSPAGAANVTDNGDNTFTVSNISANCTITINFEEIPVIVTTKIFVKSDYAPYIYTWTGSGESKIEYNGGWPGALMSDTWNDDNGVTWYTIDVPATGFNMILNDNYGSQTENINNITEDTYFVWNSSVDGYSATQYQKVQLAEVTVNNVSVLIGATEDINVSTTPDGLSLNYSIGNDDTSYATITDGAVYGVSEGTATITAWWGTQQVGDTYYAGGSKTFTVTVNKVRAYQKITSTADIVDGMKYLIVCESQNTAFKGNLTTLDANRNGEPVTIKNDKIITGDDIYFIINRNGDDYTIQSKSGYFIGHTGSGPDLKTSVTTEYPNSIEIDGGDAIILCNEEYYLQYNKTSGSERFRYYATNQEPIQLYKEIDPEVKIYVKADQAPYIYTWTGVGDAATKHTGTWPGTQAPTQTTEVNGVSWYTMTVPALGFNLILNNGNSGKNNQTANIKDIREDTYFVWNSASDGYSGANNYLAVDFAEVSASNLTVSIGKTVASRVTATPEGLSLSYSSSDGTIATVDNDGNVTGISAGDATITVSWATQGVGEQGYLGGSITYTVTVYTVTTTDYFVKARTTGELHDGMGVIIVHEDAGNDRVMGEQRNNNFGASEVTINRNATPYKATLVTGEVVTVLALEQSGNYWYFRDDFGDYLYTASTSNNTLRTKEVADNFAKTTISIEGQNSDAVITFQGTNTRNILRYNNSDNLFSCYSSGQKPVHIYYREGVILNEIANNQSVLDDNEGGRTVNLYRQLTADMWNAICLPFDVNEANMKKLFGEGYLLRSFSGVEKNGNSVTLMFSEETTIQAGVPYIVLPKKSVESGAMVVLANVTLTKTAPKGVTKTDADGNSYTFQGVYEPTSFEAGNKSIRFLGSGNKFYYPTSTNPMRAFRCYFQLPTEVAAKLSNLDMAFDGGIDVATGIIAIGTDVSPLEQATGHIYSVSGQHVGTKAEGLPKGLYIRDGKKFVVK